MIDHKMPVIAAQLLRGGCAHLFGDIVRLADRLANMEREQAAIEALMRGAVRRAVDKG